MCISALRRLLEGNSAEGTWTPALIMLFVGAKLEEAVENVRSMAWGET